MKLILYSKPGCHLCEGLQEKLEQVENPQISLEIRDITTRDDWFAAYQYAIPVLVQETSPGEQVRLPRPSPGISVERLARMLREYEQG
ncbi:glutaredoxin family protein [Geitlerinema sp. PCC 9228]|uniref:glutaredoxin family protein n=1 Tax=Geitlerinema sp. PCC 9228 TaxID=111611 RepID=UPI0008F99BEA|nr:glutaredoxin family protein [Geitlerinema sp. PCC 9228]